MKKSTAKMSTRVISREMGGFSRVKFKVSVWSNQCERRGGGVVKEKLDKSFLGVVWFGTDGSKSR